MGKILKRFIYGYIALVVVLLIGVVVMAIHHVVSTEINEKETKEFVYDFILELQEEDYETMAMMMVLENAEPVTTEFMKEYVAEKKLDYLMEMDAETYWDSVWSNGKSKKGYVDFSYDHIGYAFECRKIEDEWKILSAGRKPHYY